MIEKLEKRFDQLEQKMTENQKHLTDMIAQLMKIVGETNRKVSEIQDTQQKTVKTLDLHKRKIADLEEEVNYLKPLET